MSADNVSARHPASPRFQLFWPRYSRLYRAGPHSAEFQEQQNTSWSWAQLGMSRSGSLRGRGVPPADRHGLVSRAGCRLAWDNCGAQLFLRPFGRGARAHFSPRRVWGGPPESWRTEISPACSGVPPADAMERQALVALFEMKKPCANRPLKIPRRNLQNSATSESTGAPKSKGAPNGPPKRKKEEVEERTSSSGRKTNKCKLAEAGTDRSARKISSFFRGPLS